MKHVSLVTEMRGGPQAETVSCGTSKLSPKAGAGEKVNCPAGAREAALGRVELAKPRATRLELAPRHPTNPVPGFAGTLPALGLNMRFAHRCR